MEAVQEPELANAFVVSLHALAGIRTDNTMLLLVVIQGERLLVLLDTDSTHNFLQGDIMRRLGLQPAGGEHLRITVANGDRLPCAGIARNVPISIEGEAFSITCVGLNLGCFDCILGVDYLCTLGAILWDFEAMMMAFWRDGRCVCWQGVGAPTSVAPQQRMLAAIANAQQPMLDHLLQQHSAIFEEPQGLAPARPYDHHIHLLPDTAPFAVRP